jgi:MazG family protein
MALLRDPERGCPWDLEQSFATIAPYTIEEAYEVDDAIRREDWGGLREELGDLLLQVVFHAQMASESGHFDFEGVAEAICDKLVRRHPHVFGDGDTSTAAAQVAAWDGYKEAERSEKAAREGREPSLLDDVPKTLPALLRAAKLQRRAARAGLAPEADAAYGAALASVNASDERDLGDLLFACAQLATRAGVDPEQATREACARFEARFRALEASGRLPEGD